MKSLILSMKRSTFGRGMEAIFNLLEDFIAPLFDGAIRFWMAALFWQSGIAKVQSWTTTLSLFRYEYKIPLMNPEIAAWTMTIIELACPLFLVVGLATRLATLPLLFMMIAIQFTDLSQGAHIYWISLLTMILLKGPGKLSLDYFLFEKYAGEPAEVL